MRPLASSNAEPIIAGRMGDRTIPTIKLVDGDLLRRAALAAVNQSISDRALVESYAMRRVAAATFR
jgi:hypothetical protein